MGSVSTNFKVLVGSQNLKDRDAVLVLFYLKYITLEKGRRGIQNNQIPVRGRDKGTNHQAPISL